MGCMKTLMLRASVTCCAILIVLTTVAAQRPGAPIEQWMNPGVGPASPSNAEQFVRGTDAAFIGDLESVDASFADSQQDYLFTHLHFRVREWLYNAKGRQNDDRMDVWTLGGTYIERDGKRVVTGTADIGRRLRQGGTYFVPVKYAYRTNLAWYGKPLLVATDALASVENEHVVSVAPKSDWPQRIIASVVLTSPTPAAAGTERERFLGAIRLAAARK
jgi:hypothetical protein